MSNEVKEVVYELVGIDARTIWSSIKNLTVRPGITIKRFCDGETDFLLSPGTYFFGVMAIIYFLSSISGFEDRLHSQVQQQIIQRISLTQKLDKKKIAEGAADLSSRFGNRITGFVENDTVLKFFAVPMLLFCRWLLFRGHIRSFKSNSWYSLFTIAHMTLFSLPLAILAISVTSNLIGVVFILFLQLLYDTWASMQFYEIRLGRSVMLNMVCFIAYVSSISVLVMMIGFLPAAV